MRSRTSRRVTIASFLAIPFLIVGLASCAASEPKVDQPPASASGDSGGNAGDSDLMAWQLDYAECMRGEGIDLPDPTSGSGGLTSSSSTTADPEAMAAASEKCYDELGEPPAMSPEEQAAADEGFLKWAKEAAECYRENGYDMPDPDSSKTLNLPADATDEVNEECGGGQTAQRGAQ